MVSGEISPRWTPRSGVRPSWSQAAQSLKAKRGRQPAGLRGVDGNAECVALDDHDIWLVVSNMFYFPICIYIYICMDYMENIPN